MASASVIGVITTPDNQHEGRRAYHALDAWRGLASLWVVLYHASLSLPVLLPARAGFVPGLWLQGGYLGVPLFFVISGYCIANAAVSAARREQGAKAFFLARLRRIYPPYLAVLLLSVAVSLLSFLRILSATAHNHPFDVLSQKPLFFLAALTVTQVPLHQALVQAVFWTLNFEVAFYVVVGTLLLLPPELRTARTLLNALHVVTLSATALLVFLPGPPWFPLNFWPQFGLGALTFDIVRHPRLRFPRVALALTGAGIAGFAMMHSYGNSFVFGAPPMRIGFLVSLGFALLLLVLYPLDKQAECLPPVRLFAWLGGFSYSLYLVHPLAIGSVLYAARALNLPAQSPSLWLIGEAAVSLVCAWFFFLCCERPFLPVRKPKNSMPQAGLAAKN